MSRRPTAYRAALWGLTAGLLALCCGASLRAESRLTMPDVRSLFPALRIVSLSASPDSINFGTFRSPRLTLLAGGFELSMYWNGIDDTAWPFDRILDVLLATGCGNQRAQLSSVLQRRLYASRSSIPGQALGGSRGSTFRKSVAEQVGGCRLELTAEGAEWNTLIARVAYGAAVPTPPQVGVFGFRWAADPPAKDITAADIQHALIWTRHYGATVDGAIGPYTQRAVAGWQASHGYPQTGILSAPQTVELVREGLARRDEYGWGHLVDDTVGFSVGVPTRLASLQSPSRQGDTWTYRLAGPAFDMAVLATSGDAACESMDPYFTAIAANAGSGFEVVSKARKDDWFVLSARSSAARLYGRAQCRPGGIVTVLAKIPTAAFEKEGFLFTALSNAFSVKATLNAAAPRAAARIVLPAMRAP
ncbi:hypothetical protein BH10PSE6_BH10PSE6_16630 [soil metagenome]